MDGELKGKAALVTGGSQGIGLASARALAAEGADILLVASNSARLAASAKSIAAETGRRVLDCSADLRRLDGCMKAFNAMEAAFGGCDILVNSAGATKAGGFLDQPDEDWLDGFALKFFGAVRLCRLLWPLLTARSGVVVNIVGMASREPKPDFMIGGAVNAALANFSKALAMQGVKDDVNVNWVLPGPTLTERLEKLYAQRAAASGRKIEDLRREATIAQGVRRMAAPEDVAHLVAFLCSPRARHIQGAGVAIDGGGGRAVF